MRERPDSFFFDPVAELKLSEGIIFFGPMAELELSGGTIFFKAEDPHLLQARPYSGLTCTRVQRLKAAKTLALVNF